MTDSLPVVQIKCSACGFLYWPSAYVNTTGTRYTQPTCRTCREFKRELRHLRALHTRATQRVTTLERQIAATEARYLAYQHGDETPARRRAKSADAVTHGRLSTYRDGCRCAACRARARAAWRQAA